MRISTYIKPINVLVLLSLLIINSCTHIFDYGDWKSQQYKFTEIDNVTLDLVSNCYYHKSDSSYIEIEYYYSLLSKIKIFNNNGNIKVQNTFSHNAYTDYKKPQIHIYAPSISGINIEITSSFYCIDTIASHKFIFNVTSDLFESNILVIADSCYINLDKSVGDFILIGSIDYGYFDNHGLINFDASEISVNKLFVKHNSPYTMFIKVINQLNYNIFGDGDIVLKGEPDLTGVVLGNGRLIKQ